MPLPDDPTETSPALLERLIAEFLVAEEGGLAFDREAVMAANPHLAGELRQFFADHDRMARLRPAAQPGEGPTDAASAPTAARQPADIEETGTIEAAIHARDGLAVGARVRYVGDYEVAEELGRGGMGVVYRARQVSLNRPVALKVLRAGAFATEDDLRRFQNEAEAVALLDHPNIVPVLEVGEDSGQRYFSMKLIVGGSLSEHLTEFASDRRGSARMVAGVARAIHHAHQRGILHRDLKPANVLLDESGEPHVTDFGLARRIEGQDHLTLSGAILGTPAYMAPEQASGRKGAVTTATDVYGLGAVLYAMLAGRAPFGGNSVVDTLDQVRNVPPRPPSQTTERVPRDLEVICLKCLEKDPRRRYGSAEAVADDLDRWLRGEPISARPVGKLTRAAMWVCRNPALAGMAAALVVALISGFGLVTWKWLEAREKQRLLTIAEGEARTEAIAARSATSLADRRREDAEREADTSRTLLHFFNDDVIGQAAPDALLNLRGVRKVTIEEALDRAARGIEGQFAGRPEVEAAVRQAIATAYSALGEFAKAEPHLRRCEALLSKVRGEEDAKTLGVRVELGILISHLNHFNEAEALHRASIVDTTRFLGASHPVTLRARVELTNLLTIRNKTAEAEPQARRNVDDCVRVLGEDDPISLDAYEGHARILQTLGRLEDAEVPMRRDVAGRQRTLGAEHIRTLLAWSNLATILQAQGKLAEAEVIERRVAEAYGHVLGPDHFATLLVLGNLAAILQIQGKLDEALPIARRVVEADRRAFGPDQTSTLQAEGNLAALLSAQGKNDEAGPLKLHVYEANRRIRGDRHIETLIALNNLAYHENAVGRPKEAEAHYRRAREEFVRIGGPEMPEVLNVENNLAFVLRRRGQIDEAERMYRHAFVGLERVRGPRDIRTLTCISSLASLLKDRRKFRESESLYRRAVAGFRSLGDTGRPQYFTAADGLIDLLIDRSRTEEAIELLGEILVVRRSTRTDDPIGVSANLAMLGSLLIKANRLQEAEVALRDCLAIRRSALSPGDRRTASVEGLIGESLAKRGRFAEAEPLILASVRGTRKAPPISRIEAVDRAIALYDAWPRPEEAARWRAKRPDAQFPIDPFAKRR